MNTPEVPDLRIPLRWEDVPGWWEYADGYGDAAALLLEELKKIRHGPFPEYVPLGFPLLFVTRHYVEISLKAAVVNGSRLLYVLEAEDQTAVRQKPVPSKDVSKFGHNLRKVWDACQDLLPKVEMPWPPGEAESINDLVEWLDDLDERSLTFRYAMVEQTPDHIPLEEFAARFEAARRTLTGLRYTMQSRLRFHDLLEQ